MVLHLLPFNQSPAHSCFAVLHLSLSQLYESCAPPLHPRTKQSALTSLIQGCTRDSSPKRFSWSYQCLTWLFVRNGGKFQIKNAHNKNDPVCRTISLECCLCCQFVDIVHSSGKSSLVFFCHLPVGSTDLLWPSETGCECVGVNIDQSAPALFGKGLPLVGRQIMSWTSYQFTKRTKVDSHTQNIRNIKVYHLIG